MGDPNIDLQNGARKFSKLSFRLHVIFGRREHPETNPTADFKPSELSTLVCLKIGGQNAHTLSCMGCIGVQKLEIFRHGFQHDFCTTRNWNLIVSFLAPYSPEPGPPKPPLICESSRIPRSICFVKGLGGDAEVTADRAPVALPAHWGFLIFLA